ncbi:glycoside hydrolase domain-containing protein [Actinocorallia longicatena]|uniref:glycoside hydrolase domain-containing protein n=1 Tax=Actinocorallia longicatena TaxID=111803 RepID=UPI0031CECF89
MSIGLLGLAVLAPDLQAAASARVHERPTVTYGGLELPVPAGWRVYDLAAEPTRCVRFDEHAIYVGVPRGEQDCPARIVGRTEAVQLTPIASDGGRRRAAARRRLSSLRIEDGPSGEARIDLPEAGVRITGVYGERRDLLESTLRAASAGPGRTEAAPPEEPGTVGRRAWATGPGFDTCAAPLLSTMRAFRQAYAVANIYIGGAARGCSQYNLSASWIRSVRQYGYRLIPTYVGLQAPCTGYRTRFKAKEAAEQGRAAAGDAVARARYFGIPRKKPIYFDMENYDSDDTACRTAVMTFLHAWTRRLHELRYKSGVYSSAGSGIRDLGRATGIKKPNAVWFAHWDGKARTTGSPYLPDTWWATHRRIKQYRGGHTEKHGGVKLNVDSNMVDGLVY